MRLAMKAVRNVPQGKVKRLKVWGIHKCCELFCEAIKGAIKSVCGVTGDMAQPKGELLGSQRRLRCRRAREGAQRRRI